MTIIMIKERKIVDSPFVVSPWYNIALIVVIVLVYFLSIFHSPVLRILGLNLCIKIRSTLAIRCIYAGGVFLRVLS